MTAATTNGFLAAVDAYKSQEILFQKQATMGATLQVFTLWTAVTIPPPGSGGSALVTRLCDATTIGGLAFENPTAPDQLYLAGLRATCDGSFRGSLLLYDRVADIAGINVASPTGTLLSLTPIPWARYTSGAGVMLFLETTTALTGIPTLTLNYTTDTGDASAVTPVISLGYPVLDGQPHDKSLYLPLKAGSRGVRAVSGITITSAAAAGVVRLVIAKPLAVIPLLDTDTTGERDFITQTPRALPIPNNACLGLLLLTGNGSSNTIYGSVTAIAA